MMTIEDFNRIPAGNIFLTGELANAPEGLYMSDYLRGDMLRWVAKKGYGDDWCIYSYWAFAPIEWIVQHGDKVHTEKHIKLCVPCDDEVFSRYRY